MREPAIAPLALPIALRTLGGRRITRGRRVRRVPLHVFVGTSVLHRLLQAVQADISSMIDPPHPTSDTRSASCVRRCGGKPKPIINIDNTHTHLHNHDLTNHVPNAPITTCCGFVPTHRDHDDLHTARGIKQMAHQCRGVFPWLGNRR